MLLVLIDHFRYCYTTVILTEYYIDRTPLFISDTWHLYPNTIGVVFLLQITQFDFINFVNSIGYRTHIIKFHSKGSINLFRIAQEGHCKNI